MFLSRFYAFLQVHTAKLHLVQHLALALLAHRLPTKQGGQTHIASWAHTVLTGAANGALGLVSLHHLGNISTALDVVDANTNRARGVRATSLACVLADLSHNLGANRAGDCDVAVNVLDIDGRTSWVLVELDLGVIRNTLGRLDDVLALGGLHDDTTL